jgi:hypothetical protein
LHVGHQPLERVFGIFRHVSRKLLVSQAQTQQRRMQPIPHFVAGPLRLPLEPLADFRELLFAGNFMADNADVAGRFNSQANLSPTDAEDLQRNSQMGEQNFFVFFAR